MQRRLWRLGAAGPLIDFTASSGFSRSFAIKRRCHFRELIDLVGGFFQNRDKRSDAWPPAFKDAKQLAAGGRCQKRFRPCQVEDPEAEVASRLDGITNGMARNL